ncbi:MAG: hypothetical protein KDB80_16230, partial [Planctomycetes bacterium]|nr:hypothetical protein [Planctomycetota bacterium]
MERLQGDLRCPRHPHANRAGTQEVRFSIALPRSAMKLTTLAITALVALAPAAIADGRKPG